MTPNFHTAIMTCGDLTVGVLGHMHLPLIAVAEVSAGDVVFIDGRDDLREALQASGSFRLMTRSELETPIDSTDPSEPDIAYWKPATLGELLFNYWD
uniref:hypothetical protein n=1 Tax=Herbidospora sakaeratensis TaxID=564415 RepID=UPI000781ED7F|nr:hypothetical protein [Herbidospora sakaeratensis]